MAYISKPQHSGKVDVDHSMHSGFMRRRAAGNYLKDRYGHGSEKTLAKLLASVAAQSFTRPASGWCSIHERLSTLGHSHGLAVP